MPPIGFTLQPDHVYLDLLADVIRGEVDYYEVAPETLWAVRADGELMANGFHREFAELGVETGKPFVAHGVGLSPGTADRSAHPRRERWLAQMARDCATFHFAWYTDHFGASALGGRSLALPCPVPLTEVTAAAARECLSAMQTVVADVGVENSVFYFALGDPLAEAAFLARLLDRPGFHLLLDLHNLYTSALNFDFDAEAYLSALPLDRVIEIHLSGGCLSDPGWLPDGRTLRLDSHDHAVPEPVWSLLEQVAPRCPGLRGVTLERMEGTVTAPDVALIRDELRRARRVVGGLA